MFDGLKSRLDRLLREHSTADDRGFVSGMRDALLEARVGLGEMRHALDATEQELTSERAQLAAAERRGRLAAQVPDAETVAVAERYAARHRDRVAVLERKLAVQRDELAMAEREVQEMTSQLRKAASSAPGSESLRAAWRDLEAAGAPRPQTEADAMKVDFDRRRLDETIEAQLAYLKRKLGKQ